LEQFCSKCISNFDERLQVAKEMGQSMGRSSSFGKRLRHERHATLLIVEDQSLLAEYMADVAEEGGWRVGIAGSVRAFDRKFTTVHPDVLVLDLGLPDGDGVELLRRLSEVQYKGSILIVSSYDDDILETCQHLAEQLQIHVAGRARKPISADIFLGLLGKCAVLLPDSTILPSSPEARVPFGLQ
jgi:CheY-like chemotaxis protein